MSPSEMYEPVLILVWESSGVKEKRTTLLKVGALLINHGLLPRTSAFRSIG